jgi:hypothetical protein
LLLHFPYYKSSNNVREKETCTITEISFTLKSNENSIFCSYFENTVTK